MAAIFLGEPSVWHMLCQRNSSTDEVVVCAIKGSARRAMERAGSVWGMWEQRWQEYTYGICPALSSNTLPLTLYFSRVTRHHRHPLPACCWLPVPISWTGQIWAVFWGSIIPGWAFHSWYSLTLNTFIISLVESKSCCNGTFCYKGHSEETEIEPPTYYLKGSHHNLFYL